MCNDSRHGGRYTEHRESRAKGILRRIVASLIKAHSHSSGQDNFKKGGGPLVVENREGVFSRYPKKESGSWGESDRGGIRLWGKVYNVSAKWKVFLDLIG